MIGFAQISIQSKREYDLRRGLFLCLRQKSLTCGLEWTKMDVVVKLTSSITLYLDQRGAFNQGVSSSGEVYEDMARR